MEERRRIALLLEYDGTAFAGSQWQPAVRTVQEVLEAALREFTGERDRIAFAGRTDSGVHASGQVAALSTRTQHSAATCRDALNHFLPEDVVVRAAVEVAVTFDPRRHAEARRYRYRIEDGRARLPLTRRQAWQVRHGLEVPAMAEALALLPRTTRDWAAFAGLVPAGYPTVRTLLDAGVERCGSQLVMEIEADGFLPHQVRRTVGALERVGAGALAPHEFAALVDGPPASAGPTAPPQGLTLIAVRYPPGTVEWGRER
ncbi:MAG: tRNA pseudouridine(38-40) synthase TruA [Dehalococcoidia bacterium]|nr:tRNA pseudouridine(38-40) synthase TruA [Dehalococcoidia bacterium]